jgi:hypothetical protein
MMVYNALHIIPYLATFDAPCCCSLSPQIHVTDKPQTAQLMQQEHVQLPKLPAVIRQKPVLTAVECCMLSMLWHWPGLHAMRAYFFNVL